MKDVLMSIDIIYIIRGMVRRGSMQQVRHDLARIAKALSDDNRLRILDSLREGEKCACELLTDLRISQPTLSHHMKILCDAGLVSCRRDSRWAYYSTNARAIAAVAEELRERFLQASDAAPAARVRCSGTA